MLLLEIDEEFCQVAYPWPLDVFRRARGDWVAPAGRMFPLFPRQAKQIKEYSKQDGEEEKISRRSYPPSCCKQNKHKQINHDYILLYKDNPNNNTDPTPLISIIIQYKQQQSLCPFT